MPPVPGAGAGPAPLTAARGHGHDRGRSRTRLEGGAGPGLAAPLLRKLLLVDVLVYLGCLEKYQGGFFLLN